ncbi:hypothetical protein OL548_00955 [Lysinibacillus sp. MHQ-1]|nr:hypothetical protein OL548_00955 [Lysinibacillus sp. MHQ-1]
MALPDMEGFTRQTASFLNVLLFLLPLFIITIGSMSLAGDIESGWFSLLKTYPMKIAQYIIGKYVAISLAFFISSACGVWCCLNIRWSIGWRTVTDYFSNPYVIMYLYICLIGYCTGGQWLKQDYLH